jgi:plasmid stability protein
MSITIHLPPQTEEKLRRRAAETGVAADALAGQLLEQGLNGDPVAPARRQAAALDEIPAPFRREVEESGLTDEELKDFFTEVRDEVRAEKRARQAQG